MKKIISLSFCLVFCFLLNFNSFGQNTISENKRKLIAEMIVLTKADQQISQVTDIMLGSMEKTYSLGFNQTIDNRNDLTESAKRKLKTDYNKRFSDFSKRFRERLPQAINYPKYIEDLVFPLYDKFYTETELADLVAFYKTSTGQKLIETMPQLYKESIELTQKILLPKILKVVDELLKEDLEDVKKLK